MFFVSITNIPYGLTTTWSICVVLFLPLWNIRSLITIYSLGSRRSWRATANSPLSPGENGLYRPVPSPFLSLLRNDQRISSSIARKKPMTITYGMDSCDHRLVLFYGLRGLSVFIRILLYQILQAYLFCVPLCRERYFSYNFCLDIVFPADLNGLSACVLTSPSHNKIPTMQHA